MKDYDLGPCCICESTQAVDNLLQLDFKVESETCWGCIQCGLPMEGAVAAVCDTCMETYADDEDMEEKIKFLMDTADRRIPMPPVEERVAHVHDLSQHPEIDFEYKVGEPRNLQWREDS